MKKTKVKDVMTMNPVMIPPNATLKEAAIRMRNIDCGILPVGREDNVKGMITDRDIVVRAISQNKDASEEMIKDYMSTDVYDCHEDDLLEDAVEIMKKNNVCRLIVKDKADKTVGILSFGDALWRSSSIEEITAIVKQAANTKAA